VTGARVGIVVIGRNEGERFRACLDSLPAGLPVVYVDSGSTDGSVALAQSRGVHVVELPVTPGFTAARARNAGFDLLLRDYGDIEFVQMIDGDCTVDHGWLDAAVPFLAEDERLAVVFGRRRERFPHNSLYNAQCDQEWDVPVGEVRSCGGDALMRVAALREVDGYTADLIAGEEPDLCLRLRARGWHIRRINAEMTLHDANILRFGIWWKRAKRAGHAYAEHVWRHGRSADPDWIRALASMLVWAVLLPGLAVFALVVGLAWSMCWFVVPAMIIALAAVQYGRLVRQGLSKGHVSRYARGNARLLLIAKFAHLAGMLAFLANHARRKRHTLIEYK